MRVLLDFSHLLHEAGGPSKVRLGGLSSLNVMKCIYTVRLHHRIVPLRYKLNINQRRTLPPQTLSDPLRCVHVHVEP